MDIWNAEALKIHIDSHLAEIRSEIRVRMAEKHREHDKFESTVKESLYKQNEFREALADLGKTMATRKEIEVLDEKFNLRQTRTEHMQARIVGSLMLVSAILAPATIIATYFLLH